MTESLCSTMNFRSPKSWDTKHSVTQYFPLTVDMLFVSDFFLSFICVWLEKTNLLGFFCIHKRVKSIVFGVSIQFCDESGLAILSDFFSWSNAHMKKVVLVITTNLLEICKYCYYLFEKKVEVLFILICTQDLNTNDE